MTVLYILYYILAYIQHNGDVSLEKRKEGEKLSVLCAVFGSVQNKMVFQIVIVSAVG